ncbi:putative nucleotidyltransferase substrate binding domain-containing protein [Zoogloea sp.]|uniref:putative nucleotidyltransferase substrate binding domain-containing protein n=1 Tax=Zoogloea sp. TaxID=49181 RepID=UPI00345B5561
MGCATPDDLLNATIFFDFRAIAGDVTLAPGSNSGFSPMPATTTCSCVFTAANALQAAGRPWDASATSWWTGKAVFSTSKRDGSRIFVDAARILALALGFPTPPRVAVWRRRRPPWAGPGARWTPALGSLRFHPAVAPARPAEKAGPPNRIAPSALNELEHAFLRSPFRQARKLQQKLQFRYQL